MKLYSDLVPFVWQCRVSLCTQYAMRPDACTILLPDDLRIEALQRFDHTATTVFVQAWPSPELQHHAINIAPT